MPSKFFSQALTANQKGYNPLSSWQYEYAPYRCMVRMGWRTTGAAGNVKFALFTGSTNVHERSPMQVGGTAGVTPSPLNTPFVEFVAEPGDRIQIAIDEDAGATPTVDGCVFIDPI
jgi:hypothetical protein